MKPNTLLLVDGSGLLFQMFYGMPARIVGKNGQPVHAVVGFIGALLKVIRQTEATHVLVLFDGETGNFRSELSAYYKANRPDYSAVPEEETPFSQLPDIKRVLDRLAVPYYEVTENWEADDVIASYALSIGGEDTAVILSQDKDYLQLVSDRVRVFCYRGKQSVLYDEKTVTEKFGIAPRFFSDFKALAGDASDNVRGLPGIGPKTACELIRRFGSVSDILAHVEDIPKPTVRKTLTEYAGTLLLNKQLVILTGDVPVPYSFDKLAIPDAPFPETAEALRLAEIW
ncbi:MAG: flap endonuclease [Ruminococcus sp.]|nr:flap endonuclease [Candidatus Apopatosoma intestinale]